LRPYACYGTATSYQITGDTLRLYNLKTEQWENNIIRFLSPDTMSICYERIPEEVDSLYFYTIEYVRRDTALKSPEFDRLIISFEERAGLSSKVILLNNKGELLYFGWPFNNKYEGYYVSDQGEKAFQRICRLFRQEDFSNIPIDTIPLFSEAHDGNRGEIIFTLIQNETEITTRTIFYDDKYLERLKLYSPGFENTLLQALFLEQQMPIAPLDSSKYIAEWMPEYFLEFNFAKNDKQISLSNHQSFYLLSLLIGAENINADFTPRYTINNDVQSDGRYYRFKNKEGKWITLDIGFNFIEKNNLESRFR
jgi:hypothetical protein